MHCTLGGCTGLIAFVRLFVHAKMLWSWQVHKYDRFKNSRMTISGFQSNVKEKVSKKKNIVAYNP